MAHELKKAGRELQRQAPIPVKYDGLTFDEGFRMDLLVDNALVIELKTVDGILPIHEAQLLSYLRLSEKRIGLLINFKVRLLKDGIKRLII